MFQVLRDHTDHTDHAIKLEGVRKYNPALFTLGLQFSKKCTYFKIIAVMELEVFISLLFGGVWRGVWNSEITGTY